jgi:hypothetical protein
LTGSGGRIGAEGETVKVFGRQKPAKSGLLTRRSAT